MNTHNIGKFHGEMTALYLSFIFKDDLFFSKMHFSSVSSMHFDSVDLNQLLSRSSYV